MKAGLMVAGWGVSSSSFVVPPRIHFHSRLCIVCSHLARILCCHLARPSDRYVAIYKWLHVVIYLSSLTCLYVLVI